MQQQRQKYKSIVRNLIGELRDNLEIAPNAHSHYSWTWLSSDIWDVSKGEIVFLPPDTQATLRGLYMHVQRYNTKIEDRRAAQDHGKGHWDNTMKEELQFFSDKAPQVIESLENFLQKSYGNT